MSRDLTDAETFLLIELLQGQQNLWDTSCKTYHDRQKRTESLIYILHMLGVPELSGKFWIGVAMWLAHWHSDRQLTVGDVECKIYAKIFLLLIQKKKKVAVTNSALQRTLLQKD